MWICECWKAGLKSNVRNGDIKDVAKSQGDVKVEVGGEKMHSERIRIIVTHEQSFLNLLEWYFLRLKLFCFHKLRLRLYFYEKLWYALFIEEWKNWKSPCTNNTTKKYRRWFKDLKHKILKSFWTKYFKKFEDYTSQRD